MQELINKAINPGNYAIRIDRVQVIENKGAFITATAENVPLGKYTLIELSVLIPIEEETGVRY